ncbi:hypothetical protein V1477_003323 [Vespula maculifrons]|uniref:Uncharacterized protein n=1 Tax=Vespula maculifrons TaxID=7453 RepID=A0ABD2CU85_VESMC
MINEPMTLEVKSAIKRLKNHKTSGIDCEACHYDTRQEKNLEYSKIRYFAKLSGQKVIKKLRFLSDCSSHLSYRGISKVKSFYEHKLPCNYPTNYLQKTEVKVMFQFRHPPFH